MLLPRSLSFFRLFSLSSGKHLRLEGYLREEAVPGGHGCTVTTSSVSSPPYPSPLPMEPLPSECVGHLTTKDISE